MRKDATCAFRENKSESERHRHLSPCRAVHCKEAYFFGGGGGMVSALGVTAFRLGGTFAFTLPDAHEIPPSRTAWKIGLVQTSSRCPMEV